MKLITHISFGIFIMLTLLIFIASNEKENSISIQTHQSQNTSGNLLIEVTNLTNNKLLLYSFNIENANGFKSFLQTQRPGVFIEVRDSSGNLVKSQPVFRQPPMPPIVKSPDSLRESDARKSQEAESLEKELPPTLPHEHSQFAPHETKQFSLYIGWILREYPSPVSFTLYYRVPARYKELIRKEMIRQQLAISGRLYTGEVISNKLIINKFRRNH